MWLQESFWLTELLLGDRSIWQLRRAGRTVSLKMHLELHV